MVPKSMYELMDLDIDQPKYRLQYLLFVNSDEGVMTLKYVIQVRILARFL